MPNTKLPKFTVVPDSCCLFTPNNSQIVSHSFTELFRELKSKCDVQLAIPRIVVDELLSQKLFQSEKFLEKAVSNLRQIAKLTNSELLELPTINELRQKLKQRFDDWIGALYAVVVDVPKDIDWPALIDNAVWRRPPFSPRTEAEQNSEKGFKDALILETLLAFQKDAQDREIVFVCADALLSESATERLSNQSRFLVVQSLEAFGSHVALLLNKQSEEFSQAVRSKIGSVFYTEHDPNCVWFKLAVLERVHNAAGVRLSEFFDVYDPSSSPSLNFSNAQPVPTPLQPVTEEMPSIGETNFVTIDSDGFYHWRTEVQLRQIFGPKQVPSANASLLGFPNERLRTIVVSVKWKTKISFSPDLHFSDQTVDAIEFGSEKFGRPGWTDYFQLRHPRYSGTSLENYTGEAPTDLAS